MVGTTHTSDEHDLTFVQYPPMVKGLFVKGNLGDRFKPFYYVLHDYTFKSKRNNPFKNTSARSSFVWLEGTSVKITYRNSSVPTPLSVKPFLVSDYRKSPWSWPLISVNKVGHSVWHIFLKGT